MEEVDNDCGSALIVNIHVLVKLLQVHPNLGDTIKLVVTKPVMLLHVHLIVHAKGALDFILFAIP
eukprot:10539901-Ditylum_brightwellii.AAC.1